MSDGAVLVTGATGFLGQAVVDYLKVKGRRVRAAVRRDAGLGEVAIGDISAETDWSEALHGVETVVHCAARAHVLKETAADPLTQFRTVNVDATLALAKQAIEAGVRRLVFISSIGVNGANTRDRPFRYDDVPHPHSPYAISKYEAEQGLKRIGAATSLQITTIRSPLIVGPDPKGNLAALNRLISRRVPLPFGLATKNRRDLVSLDVLVDLIETVIDHPAAAGQTFLVCDGAAISTRVLLEWLAAAQGRSLTLLPVPPSLMTLPLKLIGQNTLASQLFGDLEIDIGHTREILGWEPQPSR